MGIKDLNKVIGRVCPNVQKQIHLSQLHGKTVVIDISLYVYKYIKSQGESEGLWLTSIVRLLCCLKRNRIKIVCVYDGIDVPIEKTKERIARSKGVQRSEERLQEVRDALCLLEDKYLISNKELPQSVITKIQTIVRRSKGINELNDSTNYLSVQDCYKTLERIEASVSSQATKVTKQHISNLKTIVELLGIPSIQAPGEAEALCAKLCKEGKAYAVLSDDTDVLAYLAPKVLSKLDIRRECAIITLTEDLLEGLSLSYDEFLDLCIMLGCDYNCRVDGYGAVKCYDLITKHRSIERIVKTNNTPYDSSSLLYERCREIFKDPAPTNIEVPYNSNPDFTVSSRLRTFISEHELKISLEEIQRSWNRFNVCFE